METIVILVVLSAVEIFCLFDPSSHTNWKLLKYDICGKVPSDRIIGGVEAQMNAYPWLARIGYYNTSSHITSFDCGAAVITSKIVIGAAHCVADMQQNNKVSVIRLGEHNTDTNPDCEDNVCAAPVVDIKPKEIIIHKDFSKTYFKNDICLIRLADEIKFTDFVKPICLPTKNLLQKNFSGSLGEVGGWGIVDIRTKEGSHKLLVLKIPILKNEECKERIPPYIKLDDTAMCAGGEVGKDSCGGDSGGPLMIVDDDNGGPHYYILGIVSFGAKKCGKSNTPGVYTKITSHLNWILDNLDSTKSSAIKIPL